MNADKLYEHATTMRINSQRFSIPYFQPSKEEQLEEAGELHRQAAEIYESEDRNFDALNSYLHSSNCNYAIGKFDDHLEDVKSAADCFFKVGEIVPTKNEYDDFVNFHS